MATLEFNSTEMCHQHTENSMPWKEPGYLGNSYPTHYRSRESEYMAFLEQREARLNVCVCFLRSRSWERISEVHDLMSVHQEKPWKEGFFIWMDSRENSIFQRFWVYIPPTIFRFTTEATIISVLEIVNSSQNASSALHLGFTSQWNQRCSPVSC